MHYYETYRFEVQLDKLAVAIPPQFCHKHLIEHQHQRKARRLQARFATPPEFRALSQYYGRGLRSALRARQAIRLNPFT